MMMSFAVWCPAAALNVMNADVIPYLDIVVPNYLFTIKISEFIFECQETGNVK